MLKNGVELCQLGIQPHFRCSLISIRYNLIKATFFSTLVAVQRVNFPICFHHQRSKKSSPKKNQFWVMRSPRIFRKCAFVQKNRKLSHCEVKLCITLNAIQGHEYVTTLLSVNTLFQTFIFCPKNSTCFFETFEDDLINNTCQICLKVKFCQN